MQLQEFQPPKEKRNSLWNTGFSYTKIQKQIAQQPLCSLHSCAYPLINACQHNKLKKINTERTLWESIAEYHHAQRMKMMHLKTQQVPTTYIVSLRKTEEKKFGECSRNSKNPWNKVNESTNKNQTDMKVEIRKLQTKISGFNSLVAEMKTH